MKQLPHLIKSLRVEILCLFIIAVVAVLLIDFYLIGIPELFNGGYKIGQVIYKLSMSYISAFIFYFLIVHMKVQKDKATVNPFVKLMVGYIISNTQQMINVMANASSVPVIDRFPTSEELDRICKGINPYGASPMVFSNAHTINANWLQYLDNGRENTTKNIQKVFSHLPFLDAELVTILAKIEDNSHFQQVKMFSKIQIGNKDLEYFQEGFKEYLDLIKQLIKYESKKLTKYK